MFMDIGGGIRLRVYDSRKENILQEKKKVIIIHLGQYYINLWSES